VGEVDPTVVVFLFPPKKKATTQTTNHYPFDFMRAYNIYPQSLCDLKPLFFWLPKRMQKSIFNSSVICEDKRIEVYDVTNFPYMQNR
jgi:hypothetical protein